MRGLPKAFRSRRDCCTAKESQDFLQELGMRVRLAQRGELFNYPKVFRVVKRLRCPHVGPELAGKAQQTPVPANRRFQLQIPVAVAA